jgi:hypothetical protein
MAEAVPSARPGLAPEPPTESPPPAAPLRVPTFYWGRLGALLALLAVLAAVLLLSYGRGSTDNTFVEGTSSPWRRRLRGGPGRARGEAPARSPRGRARGAGSLRAGDAA